MKTRSFLLISHKTENKLKNNLKANMI